MLEKLLLNPAFIGVVGVVIGSFLSLIGNLLAQYISSKKEERQWERQRVEAKEEREGTSKDAEIIYLRELYHNCISFLSVYISALKGKIPEEAGNLSKEINDIHQWLSLLLVRHPHKAFDQLMNDFMSRPDWSNSEDLRSYVLKLIESEEKLFSSIPASIQGGNKEKNKVQSRTINFYISQDFRREQLLKAIELPQSFPYNYQLKDLLPSQIERLLKIHFNNYKTIPYRIHLILPVYNPKSKTILYSGSNSKWFARINPQNSNLNEVLEAWGKDFDIAFEKAESSLNNK